MRAFTVTTEITAEKVAGLLCSAFEGGSYGCGSWCRIMTYRKPRGAVKPLLGDGMIHEYCDYPVQGGAVVCRVDDDDTGTDEGDKDYEPLVLNGKVIQRGLDLMAAKHPKHFAAFVADQYDAITGDVLVQLSLLGELVYG